MGNISKFQLIFLGIFAAFIILGVLLFAAGGRGAGGEKSNIVIWGTMPQQIFSDVYSQLPLSKSKTISVRYEEKPAANFDTLFVEALAEGIGPDVIFISHDNLLKNKNKLLNIPYSSYSERSFRDTFVEGADIFLTPEGFLALPITLDPLVMYWNRDIFTNAGLTEPPAFWDEYFNLSGKLTTKDGAFNITRSTVALGEYSNITNAKEILSALIFQAGSPIVASTNGIPVALLASKFDLPVPPGQSALSFYTEFSNPSKQYHSWNRSLPESQTAFLAGDLAVYFGFASEYPILKLKNPNLNFDIRAFPQSSNVRTGARKVTYGTMSGMAIVKNSRNIGPAFTVMVELGNKAAAKEFSDLLSIAPIRRDLLAENQTDQNRPVFYESALSAKGWLDPDKNATETIFKNMIESVTGGRARLEAAISQANAEISALLNK